MIKTDLSGRVAMILEGDTPFGRALVKAFSYCGAKIALCHAPEASPEAVKAALAESLTEAKAFEIDMNDQDHMDVIRDRVVEAFGKIDILVNNTMAETSNEPRMLLHEVPLDEYIAAYTRCVNSVVKLTHFVTQDMDKRKKGAVVNVFTIRGLTAVANQTLGVTAGASLVGMSKMWGVELLDSHIRVNGVACGVLEEDPPLPSGRGDAYRFSHAAVKRPCRDEEAAAAVVFLASDEASYITGAVLPVDGGISAGYARSF